MTWMVNLATTTVLLTELLNISVKTAWHISLRSVKAASDIQQPKFHPHGPDFHKIHNHELVFFLQSVAYSFLSLSL